MINRAAILHIPLSQYAFANSETNITFRLKTAKDNVKRSTIFIGDRVQPSDPIQFVGYPMNKIGYDLVSDYYEVTLNLNINRICYYFELADEEETIYLYSDILDSVLPVERSEFYQYPIILRSEISDVPDWLKRAVVYNIFPDSFASSKRKISGHETKKKWTGDIILKSRLGGTIKGIMENMDYIADMGFNCLYLNPFFTAGEYHKYDLLDYFHVSPDRGTDDDFRELVKEAHKKNIKVIIDGVFNHCSWKFFAFEDVVRNEEKSEYKDWFYSVKYPVIRPDNEMDRPEYETFAYERKMPKLNTANEEVQRYFAEVGAYWIREFDVDGWRLDVANEVDKNFWRRFKKAIRAEKKDSVMIGEIWESAEVWLRGDMFDSTMNYDFRRYCRDFFALSKIKASVFHDRIMKMLMRYPTGVLQGQLNLLDSHDVNRFFSYCDGDIRRLKLAFVFLYTMPGAACIFYGDEYGMDGNSEFTLRGPMPWKEHKYDESALLKKLSEIRRAYTSLIYGEFRVEQIDDNGLYCYSRREESKEEIVVALNVSTNPICLGGDEQKRVLLQEGYDGTSLSEFGYVIWR